MKIKEKAYLDVNTGIPSADEAKRAYLKLNIQETTLSSASLVIAIGKNSSTVNSFNSHTKKYFGWYYDYNLKKSYFNNKPVDGFGYVGLAFNTITGLYDMNISLPSHSVDKFFGVACPATLNDDSTFVDVAQAEFSGSSKVGDFVVPIEDQRIINNTLHANKTYNKFSRIPGFTDHVAIKNRFDNQIKEELK